MKSIEKKTGDRSRKRWINGVIGVETNLYDT